MNDRAVVPQFIAAAHARTVSLDPAADIKAFGAQKDVAAYVSDPVLLQTLIRQTTYVPCEPALSVTSLPAHTVAYPTSPAGRATPTALPVRSV